MSGSYEAAVRGRGVAAAVDAGSPAWRAGMRDGDVVVSVDGRPVRDVIDWQWLTAEDAFEVGVRGADGSGRVLEVERSWDEPVGVSFASPVFDGVRECDNACAFCFVSQLPPGLRPALYVRDDDYRLSFLAGTFVTLTNLDDDDVDRIVGQRLSPLHVSLHAVDADVRRSLVCPTVEDRALEWFDALAEAGIELHVQIVLVPGVNDGEVLKRTLEWIAARPSVESVGVVPLGFTAHQKRFARSYDAPEAAAAVVDSLAPWAERMLRERGVRWVYAADELYLAAGRDIPPEDAYDGFPQYENGIGLVRAFTDEWTDAVGRVAVDLCRTPTQAVLVTGELFAPVLAGLARAMAAHAIECEVLAVPNRFFGGNVNVTGLLTAADIAESVRGSASAGPFLVPDIVLNDDGLTLDGVRGEELSALTAKDVRVVSCDAAGLVSALVDLSDERSRAV